MKKLPKGIDVMAARQILNEIVVRGDEVHWDDVAGLEPAKKALKEAVVYPFLRPDLFMGLREPAKGMLLFGPPGTGKTMLARAVATESKSTFFSVSASSLTSKWHGESEKLVRALFGLAKVLAPSIIFVDEIDSLLSTRSSGTEHEASRRSKTEFLIQWSDLQRAAAGRDPSDNKREGDASRVLVLAATNMPWDIDEAARRRFVRRQYIPLPEDHVREQQLRRLLSHQKHELLDEDIEVLVRVTEGQFISQGGSLSRSNFSFLKDSLALISPRWPRMRPWDPFVIWGRLCCILRWTRFAPSGLRTLKPVSTQSGRASAKMGYKSMKTGPGSTVSVVDNGMVRCFSYCHSYFPLFPLQFDGTNSIKGSATDMGGVVYVAV
jgi:DNA polymerase III delta prime subunit